MTEQAVVDATVRVLDARGAVHFNIAAGNGETGLPDRFFAYRGHGGFIEAKRPKGGRLSPKQTWWLDRLAGAGMWTLVVIDADQVRRALDKIDEIEDGRGL